jgi:5-methylcytosine-specific restriction endonuclease McrA
MSNLEVHHKQFRSRSGHDSEETLITLCAKCRANVHVYNNWKRKDSRFEETWARRTQVPPERRRLEEDRARAEAWAGSLGYETGLWTAWRMARLI